MRIATIAMAIAVVAVGSLPGIVAEPSDAHKAEHANWAKCENRFLVGNPGVILSGEHCVVPRVGFWSGSHFDLEILPFVGYDLRNVTLDLYAHEDGHAYGWNQSAAPVFSCLEGFDDDVFLQCPTQVDTLGVSHGMYVAVMQVGVNMTEIAPTVLGVTVPTALFLSGGSYGFELWYNYNCNRQPDLC